MTTTLLDLGGFGEDLLRDRLHTAAAERRLGKIAVAMFSQGREIFASVDASRPVSDRRFSENYPVRIGCLAKILTATLVAYAVHERRLVFDADLGDVLAVSELRGVTVAQALNHTHGLDGSAIAEAPLTDNGRLDAEVLCRAAFRAPRLSAPGEMYNYGSIGPWLAAAALERLYESAFTDVLKQKLLQPLGIEAAIKDAEGPCPANGGSLQLSARELLRIVSYHLPARTDLTDARSLAASFADLRSIAFEPRGWQPKLSKACLGWNDCGGGYFGHNSILQNCSAIVRFCPSTKLCIVITGEAPEASYVTLATLFADLPEFTARQIPRQVDPEEWLTSDPHSYIGVYKNASNSAVVDLAANKSLRVCLYYRRESSASPGELLVRRYLKPAANDVFFPYPREPSAIPYVQFIRQSAESPFLWLETGRQLLRRIH